MDQNGREQLPAAVIPPLECSWDEAIARFYREWVLFQILEQNEHHEPVRGLVHAHSTSHDAIYDVLETLPFPTAAEPGGPPRPYYPFFARIAVHADETDEEALARFRRQRAAFLAENGATGG